MNNLSEPRMLDFICEKRVNYSSDLLPIEKKKWRIYQRNPSCIFLSSHNIKRLSYYETTSAALNT